MIKKILKLFIFLLIIAGGYIAFFSVYKVDKKQIGVIYDLRSDKIEKLFNKEYNFIWQGAAFWWYKIYKMPTRKVSNFTVSFPVPGLNGLQYDQYQLNVPVKLIYSIRIDTFYDLSKLKDDGKELESFIQKQVKGEVEKQIYSFAVEKYSQKKMYQNIDSIKANCHESLASQLAAIGIKLDTFDFMGLIHFPDNDVYAEGIKHLSQLRDIEQKSLNNLKLMESKLAREKLQKEEYFATLKIMSGIIKNNPDILKYIYIDKIAGNLNRMKSNDIFDYPDMLKHQEEQVQNLNSKNKEIDNLR